MDSVVDKRALRKGVRERLAAVSDNVKAVKSTMLVMALARHVAVRDARVIALFSPLPDEPQIGELVDFLAKKEYCVVLPRVEGAEMRFYTYHPLALQKGAYGIMEPVGDAPVAPGDIDVMVVPGVAFTAAGARLGRGKGFYDKYMSQKGFRARRIGVCYAEQMCVSLPCEPHDIVMDEVLSR